MIEKLLKEIRNVNNENYAKVVSQKINVLEFDIPEGILYLDFNNKLKLKLTHNDNKGFLKFEVLEQDKRFWSQDSSEVFSYEAENGVHIMSDFYLDIDKAFSYVGLLGSQSLIDDGVTIYLPKYIAESETHYVEKIIKVLEALMDWSHNAPEFNIKEEVQEIQLIKMSKEQELFRLFEQSEFISDAIKITGFNFIENFDKESSLIMIKIKKEDII